MNTKKSAGGGFCPPRIDAATPTIAPASTSQAPDRDSAGARTSAGAKPIFPPSQAREVTIQSGISGSTAVGSVEYWLVAIAYAPTSTRPSAPSAETQADTRPSCPTALLVRS